MSFEIINSLIVTLIAMIIEILDLGLTLAPLPAMSFIPFLCYSGAVLSLLRISIFLPSISFTILYARIFYLFYLLLTECCQRNTNSASVSYSCFVTI